MSGKYFWRSGREKCFSLDIPLYRTSGSERFSNCSDSRAIEGREVELVPSKQDWGSICREGVAEQKRSMSCSSVRFLFQSADEKRLHRVRHQGHQSSRSQYNWSRHWQQKGAGSGGYGAAREMRNVR